MVVDVFAFCEDDEVVACVVLAVAVVEEAAVSVTAEAATATVDVACVGEFASIDPTTTPVLMAAVAAMLVVRTRTNLVPRSRRRAAVLMVCPHVRVGDSHRAEFTIATHAVA